MRFALLVTATYTTPSARVLLPCFCLPLLRATIERGAEGNQTQGIYLGGAQPLVIARCHIPLSLLLPLPLPTLGMSEWVPSMVMEVRLLWLVEDGLLPPKQVTRWRTATGEVLPNPRPREMVSFTDFHERGFRILALDFLRGILQEHGIQMQHLPPNGVLE